MKIGGTILKTGQVEVMKPWYQRILGVEVLFEHRVPAGTRPADHGGQTRAKGQIGGHEGEVSSAADQLFSLAY